MLEMLILLVCGSILVSGVLAVLLSNLMAAMVSAGLASLFAAASYVLLAAPDVAMAEAAINATRLRGVRPTGLSNNALRTLITADGVSWRARA